MVRFFNKVMPRPSRDRFLVLVAFLFVLAIQLLVFLKLRASFAHLENLMRATVP